MMNLKAKVILSACAITVGCAAPHTHEPVKAPGGVFYYCNADSADNKTYYLTELFQGDYKIVSMTGEFKYHLQKTYGLGPEPAICSAYGRENKPVEKQVAEKFWNLELQKKQLLTTIELVDWPPN